MKATWRPLAAWPYPEQQRRPATYRVGYSRTLDDLEHEIELLGGSEVIIGAVVSERDLRMDGQLRLDARLGHPGIELSFEVPDGRRLTFHTDVHDAWRDNLRAIALGLESLRAVQRYGITTGLGEQYAGFAALTAGGPDPEKGRKLVEAEGGSIRKALMRYHPDQGGDPKLFADVQAYRDSIGGQLT